MKQLEFNIPDAVITYNYLYEQMPVDWREEDLLFVRLPNGCVIDVGWYPACDPTGRFKVALSDSAQNPIDTIRVLDLDQVVRAVEGLALGSMQTVVLPTSVSLENAVICSSQNSAHPVSCSIISLHTGDTPVLRLIAVA
jgi:hypothetical protein